MKRHLEIYLVCCLMILLYLVIDIQIAPCTNSLKNTGYGCVATKALRQASMEQPDINPKSGMFFMETRDIPFAPNYSVTDQGDVYSKNYGRTGETKKLKMLKTPQGYDTVDLMIRRKKYKHSVHQLVAILFIPNPDGLPWINHKNSIRDDNRVKNLEWCTPSENVLHAYKSGKMKPTNGERHGNHILTERQVKEIREKYKLKGNTYRSLGKEYGVCYTTIFMVIKKVNWKHI